ncbi:MAG TPA: DEAD/DEAH box helicase family protein [Solirubrobacteraceae bacterium]|nr:DEAD/DEAH box helicase family protein [Solirubrobacteraceae bacterium]
MSVTTRQRPRTGGAGGSGGLREWQQRALAGMARWDSGSFLISAAPGAGKTRPALEFARRELAAGAVDGVVIACPTAPLTRQWARAAHALGLELAPDAESPRPPRGFHGVVVTYARIAGAPRTWAGGTRERTLIIADEAHHLGEELAWGVAFGEAFAAASRWLLLSGTPFRSDATPIPGVVYDANGLAEPDVSYSYAEAVRDRVCRPVVFVTYDGMLSWRSGDDVIESSFDTVLTSREASRRYRTAISTDLPDGLPRILGEADVRLRALRAGAHPDAGGLVVAADSEHARKIAARLREVSGVAPVVVLHQDPRAAAKLTAFTRSADPWIVAVNMVSEGVDIPRLRVGVYATAAKTPLIFRQIVGRFVRTIPGRRPEPSWLYIPADAVLRDHAATVETELRYLVRRREESDAELDGVERRETERGEVLDFEPLSADVAPQMTLFGPAPVPDPQPVVGVVPAAGAATAEVPPPPDPAAESVPLFERRAQLRARRHKLVGELARDRRLRHSDVNAEVNRAIGVDSVQRATIEQLERSIAWLDRALYGR